MVLALFATLAALVALAAGRSPESAATLPVPAVRSFEKGMVFGLFAREEAEHTETGLAEIAALGAESISIMIPWVTPDVRSMEMAPRSDMTPSDASLVRAIRKAHARGMTVLIMPFLYVDKMAPGEWRGTIQPADWSRWFDRYAAFILHYGRIAGAEKVEYFSVGSELCSTEARRDDWVGLIDRLRQVYGGRVTYSANWDHRGSIAFADRLDLLGMNAYFKLSEAKRPSEEDLVASWSRIAAEVEAWRAATGKRLMITEVGYPSREGASFDPWDYDAAGAPAPDEQLKCYRAFRKAWGGSTHLQGVYFYQWWGQGGLDDTGYTPRGKPAEQVIRDWFIGSSPRAVGAASGARSKQ